MMYPEHEKLKLVRDKKLVAEELMNWLEKKGYVIQALDDRGAPMDNVFSSQSLVYEFLGVDRKKLSEELDVMVSCEHCPTPASEYAYKVYKHFSARLDDLTAKGIDSGEAYEEVMAKLDKFWVLLTEAQQSTLR
jgi:hypothetical protein